VEPAVAEHSRHFRGHGGQRFGRSADRSHRWLLTGKTNDGEKSGGGEKQYAPAERHVDLSRRRRFPSIWLTRYSSGVSTRKVDAVASMLRSRDIVRTFGWLARQRTVPVASGYRHADSVS